MIHLSYNVFQISKGVCKCNVL